MSGPASWRASSGGAAFACHAASASSGTLASREGVPARQQRAREQREQPARIARPCQPHRGRLREIGIAGVEELDERRRHDCANGGAARGRVAKPDDGGASHFGRPPRIGGQREQRLQRTGGRLAAKPEAGGRDDTGLSAVERLDQLRRRRRVGQAAEAPDRDGAKSVVRVGPA